MNPSGQESLPYPSKCLQPPELDLNLNFAVSVLFYLLTLMRLSSPTLTTHRLLSPFISALLAMLFTHGLVLGFFLGIRRRLTYAMVPGAG